MASPDLIWSIVRNQSAFVLKRKGVEFNTSPFALSGKNTFQESGLSNRQAIGVEKGEKGTVIVVKSTKASNAQKPSKLFNKITTTSNPTKAAKNVLSNLASYRPDLRVAASRRFTALNRK